MWTGPNTGVLDKENLTLQLLYKMRNTKHCLDAGKKQTNKPQTKKVEITAQTYTINTASLRRSRVLSLPVFSLSIKFLTREFSYLQA